MKILAPTWNDKLELPNGSYSISDIQHCFEHILNKHDENIDNPSVKIYANKKENRIIFKMKTGFYRDLLISETMKLNGSTENKITKDKNGENVPHLVIPEVLLVRFNIVDNDNQ